MILIFVLPNDWSKKLLMKKIRATEVKTPIDINRKVLKKKLNINEKTPNINFKKVSPF